jgi:hypothetical protein
MPHASIIENFVRPFDLSKPPLLRVSLIHTEETNILLLDMHHIIADGVSYSILEKEFYKIYNGNGDELPALKLQYKDYSEWQNSEEQQERIKKQKEYWLKRFNEEVPLLNLQYDFDRPPVKSFKGGFLYYNIEKELCIKLDNLIKESESTLYIVLLSAYYVLLSKYSNSEDIVVGSPITGRSHADLHNILGMFVNMLSLRNRPEGNKTFTEFLVEVKDSVVSAMENQDYQFDQLVGELGLQGVIDRNPIFDAVFALQNLNESDPIKMNSGSGADNHSYEKNSHEPGYDVSKFDLLFSAVKRDSTINITVEYSTSLFKKSTVEVIYKHYVEILNQVLENINIKLDEIQLTHDYSSITSNVLEEGYDESFGF